MENTETHYIQTHSIEEYSNALSTNHKLATSG
jgi:hypothetical protein